jgi:hypothetical protein
MRGSVRGMPGNRHSYRDSEKGSRMIGKCKLCGNEGDLEESHFIPRFVGKWIKKTSITGYLREYNEPHKRAQDTAKEYWLCGECEDKFSVWETKFANSVFHPFVNGKASEASYENWMSKFCASLSWRTLTYIRFKNPKKDQTEEYYETIGKAEKHLADYLLGKVDYLYQYEQHLFPLEGIDSTSSPDLPPNINRYFLRTMAYFPRILILTFRDFSPSRNLISQVLFFSGCHAKSSQLRVVPLKGDNF